VEAAPDLAEALESLAGDLLAEMGGKAKPAAAVPVCQVEIFGSQRPVRIRARAKIL
jgi:hypothetical protein